VIGEVLGNRYKLVSLLGRGGMGAVYEAFCEQTGARFAVKVLHDHLAEGEAAQRFRREADAARRVDNPHIVRIVEGGTCRVTGHHFLVTELLEGHDVQHWLDRIGPISLRGALRITAQALRGLREAHAARVVHRDIKPGNLFLVQNPNGSLVLKILDFGIAKVHREPFSQAATTNMTATGSLLGSPLYMSPEQVQDSRNVDHRTDLWSLGSVLYALLSGHAPHQHLSSIGQLLVAICVHPARPLVEVAPWVPAEVAAIVHRALEIDPAARHSNAAAMLADVERFVTDGALIEDDLLSSNSGFRAAYLSSLPPGSPARLVVRPSEDKPIRGDAATVLAPVVEDLARTEMHSRIVERSAVPKLGAQVAGRHVTVDPRRLLGEKSELWTLSLDVHRNLSTLISRIWKALRRAGAKIPPMSYGTEWVLYEPRTRTFVSDIGRDGQKITLDEAGIRSGSVLWIMVPEGKTGDAVETGAAGSQ
jgi:serine/threonine protein kinase